MRPERTSQSRPQVTDAQIEIAIEQLKSRLQHAVSKHGRGAFVSAFEAIGRAESEMREVCKEADSNNIQAVCDEMLDVCAVLIFAIAGASDEPRA